MADNRSRIGWLVTLALLASASLVAQTPGLAKDPGPFLAPGQFGDAPAPPGVAGPTPRLPNGLPDLGGKGAWYPGFAGNIAEPQWKGVHSADKHVDVPFLPWAVQVFNQRVETLSKDDPEARCLPVGVPRYMFDAYAFQVIQMPEQVVFLFEGDNYPWRIIRINSTHPKDLSPTWMGDAVGHWEGDTLVVDTTNFNGKSWLDEVGEVVTHAEHVLERFTMIGPTKVAYTATVDDPLAYSRPWTIAFTLNRARDEAYLEEACLEGNQAFKLMKGAATRAQQEK